MANENPSQAEVDRILSHRERIYAAIKPLGWTLYGFDGCPTQAGFTCFEGVPFRSREIRVEPPLFAIIERMHVAENLLKGINNPK